MAVTAIHRVTALELTLTQRPWAFAQARQEEIDAHFADQCALNPALWNGPILLGSEPHFADGCLRAKYLRTDFASFLAWRDWDFPDTSVFNGFGMGALRSRDGAFVLGEMAGHTANAGKVYFPSGTPDLNDLRGDRIDIAGSVVREVAEETGLQPADYVVEPLWHCIVARGVIAMIRILQCHLDGAALHARIVQNLAAQTTPEFCRLHLVRRMSDVTPAMPAFVKAFLAAAFEERR